MTNILSRDFCLVFLIAFAFVSFVHSDAHADTPPTLSPLAKASAKACPKWETSESDPGFQSIRKSVGRDLFCDLEIVHAKADYLGPATGDARSDKRRDRDEARKAEKYLESLGLDSGDGLTGGQSAPMDQTYLHSQLQLLRFALSPMTSALGRKDREKAFDRLLRDTTQKRIWLLPSPKGPIGIAQSYAAWKSLDRTKLTQEMKNAGFGNTAWQKEVSTWLKMAQQYYAKVEEIFENAGRQNPAFKSWLKDSTRFVQTFRTLNGKQKGILGSQNAIVQKLESSQSLSFTQCDKKMVSAYFELKKQSIPYDIEHPLSVRARTIASLCARSRGDEALAAVYQRLAFGGPSNIQPLSALGIELMRRLAASGASSSRSSAQRSGRRSRRSKRGSRSSGKGARLIGSKTGFPARYAGELAWSSVVSGATEVPSNFSLNPRRGAIKITSVKSVTLDGVDYWLATGTPSKEKHYEGTNCTTSRTGAYRIRKNRIEPVTKTTCSSFKVEMVDVPFNTVLVPKFLLSSIRKGKWYRFATIGSRTASKRPSHPEDWFYYKDLGSSIRWGTDIRADSSRPNAKVKIAIPYCIAKKAKTCSMMTGNPPSDEGGYLRMDGGAN